MTRHQGAHAQARAAIATSPAYPQALQHLTTEIATGLEFSELAVFKTLLKKFFSSEDWTDEDAAALADLVGHGEGQWRHELDAGFILEHGFVEGRYRLSVSGEVDASSPSIFDRVFAGPIRPEATPHPRKVKFVLGGEPRPGIWYKAGEPTPDDERVQRLFAEGDVTDVMVAGDFVTVGLARSSSWEDRLELLLALVAELFEHQPETGPVAQTRDEMLDEAGRLRLVAEELHLLDPDDAKARGRLQEALSANDARTRRIAVAVLAQSTDRSIVGESIRKGAADESKIVRRTAIDSGADSDDADLVDVFLNALNDPDAWIRWKATRSLREFEYHDKAVFERLLDDEDFQVRMEAETALRR
ncbi:MAG: HEAT repeat domain-containing protein [Acidimicrobiia bacterium]|nr:HEAT repeat domain-containing protein [Acidimicrobiia bacterium]